MQVKTPEDLSIHILFYVGGLAMGTAKNQEMTKYPPIRYN